MPRLVDLDDMRRCTFCRHYYERRNGKARQLPLLDIPGVGLVCDACRVEVLSPRWPDDTVRAIDGVAAETGELVAW